MSRQRNGVLDRDSSWITGSDCMSFWSTKRFFPAFRPGHAPNLSGALLLGLCGIADAIADEAELLRQIVEGAKQRRKVVLPVELFDEVEDNIGQLLGGTVLIHIRVFFPIDRSQPMRQADALPG